MKPSRPLFFLLFLIIWPALCKADAICFQLAESVYEQLYCEIKVKKPNSQLPELRDFIKNDQTAQALLLKKYGSAIGVDIKMPKTASSPTINSDSIFTTPDQSFTDSAPVKATEKPNGSTRLPPQRGQIFDSCGYKNGVITCDNLRYFFVKNKNNGQLTVTALAANNTLGLEPYTGNIHDIPSVTEHLKASYGLYLQKMIEIGLSESTMTFNKFTHFFFDITEKGYSFNERFEVMFKYLKLDKTQIAVPISKSPPQTIALENCFSADETLISCSQKTKNYIFGHSPQ